MKGKKNAPLTSPRTERTASLKIKSTKLLELITSRSRSRKGHNNGEQQLTTEPPTEQIRGNGPILNLQAEMGDLGSKDTTHLERNETFRNIRQQRTPFIVSLKGNIVGEYRRTPDTQDTLVQYLLTQKSHLKSDGITPISIQSLRQKCTRALARSHRMLANSRFDKLHQNASDTTIQNNTLEKMNQGPPFVLNNSVPPPRAQSVPLPAFSIPKSSLSTHPLCSTNSLRSTMVSTSMRAYSNPSPISNSMATMYSSASQQRTPLTNVTFLTEMNMSRSQTAPPILPSPSKYTHGEKTITSDTANSIVNMHLEEAAQDSLLMQQVTGLDNTTVIENNKDTKNSIECILKKAEEKGGISYLTPIPTKKSTKFPTSELKRASHRLSKVRIGESCVQDLRNLPEIEEMFPPISLIEIRKKTCSNNLSNMDDETSIEEVLALALPDHSIFSALRSAIDVDSAKISSTQKSLQTKRQMQNAVVQQARIQELEKNIQNSMVDTASDLDRWMGVFDKQTAQSCGNMQSYMVASNITATKPSAAIVEQSVDDDISATIRKIDGTLDSYLHKRMPHKLYSKIEKETSLSFLRARIWRPRFVKSQIHMQQSLLGMLDSRERDRSIVYHSKEHLALVAQRAMRDAHFVWEVYRGVKKSDSEALEKSSNLQQQLERQTKALERAMQLLENHVWRKARVQLEERNQMFFEALLFYRKLLIFIDFTRSPSSKSLLHFLQSMRSQLMSTFCVNKELLFHALDETQAWESSLSTTSPDTVGLIESRESIKLLQYLVNDLNVDSKEFFDYFKKRNWKFTKEFNELKTRLQDREAAT